jgi:PAS domain S-box-containing protein
MTSASEMIQISLIGEAMDDGPALVFVADEQMKYVAVNRLAADVLGYTRDELLGMRVTDVVRAAAAPAEYQEMVASGERTGDAVLTTRDGRELVFQYRAGQTQIAKLRFYVSVGFVVDRR